MSVINVTPIIDITELIASDNVNEGDVILLEEGIYFQTVNVLKNNIRIVAKGPGVIFDGRSTLLTAFTLPEVSGVVIEGINIRYYRGDGILIEFGSGNRIISNTINNMLNIGIDVMGSRGNLIWKNEICSCLSGIRLTFGGTNNWVIDNVAKECLENGFETVISPDSNNAFLSNIATRNTLWGFDINGNNNLLLDNSSINNDQGVLMDVGRDSLTIGNIIMGSKINAHFTPNGYSNNFVSQNYIECNSREGIANLGKFGIILDNQISYNSDNGISLAASSIGNLVMNNKLVCNIPKNIVDRGISNNLINNIDKPCESCESQKDVCHDRHDKEENGSDGSKEGVN